MYINFELLNENDRIWIYQADRELVMEEISLISNQIKDFINKWESHGMDVKGSFQILHNRFIIIASSNDASISGCGIDKSVNLIKSLSTQLQLNLIDRNIAYVHENALKTCAVKEWKELINLKIIGEQTLIFNPMISTINDLKTNWKIPAHTSWLSKYFLVKV